MNLCFTLFLIDPLFLYAGPLKCLLWYKIIEMYFKRYSNETSDSSSKFTGTSPGHNLLCSVGCSCCCCSWSASYLAAIWDNDIAPNSVGSRGSVNINWFEVGGNGSLGPWVGRKSGLVDLSRPWCSWSRGFGLPQNNSRGSWCGSRCGLWPNSKPNPKSGRLGS